MICTSTGVYCDDDDIVDKSQHARFCTDFAGPSWSGSLGSGASVISRFVEDSHPIATATELRLDFPSKSHVQIGSKTE